jgi:hypothetical protein
MPESTMPHTLEILVVDIGRGTVQIVGDISAADCSPPLPLWAEYLLVWDAPDAGSADVETLPCRSLVEAAEEQKSWGGEIFQVERGESS